jgi:N6-L-threonylcarbamoyladenine synthase
MDKLKLVKTTGINQIAIGGVWIQVFKYLKEAEKWMENFYPQFEYTTDNAAMIGIWDIKILKSKFERNCRSGFKSTNLF